MLIHARSGDVTLGAVRMPVDKLSWGGAGGKGHEPHREKGKRNLIYECRNHSRQVVCIAVMASGIPEIIRPVTGVARRDKMREFSRRSDH
jgi:hypothetical protein